MQLPQEIPYRNLTPGLGPKTAPSSKAKDNVRKRRQNSNNSMIKNPSKIQKPVM